MHVVIALFCSCSTVLYCQHVPCADPFSGCNVLCCRLFRRGVRFVRSLSCNSAMPLELMDSLYLPSLPLLSYYMALSHIYCNKFSFETFDVISVWLLLCYKSFKYCVVSALLIQGWHRSIEIRLFEIWSLRDGIRAHADYRTRPLS